MMRQAAVSKDFWGVSSYVSVAAWVLWTCGSRPELLPSLSLDMSRALFSGLEVRFLMVSVRRLVTQSLVSLDHA